jgi:integrase
MTPPVGSLIAIVATSAESIRELAVGHVFRAVNRVDQVGCHRLGEKVVWQMLRQYAAQVGIPGVTPHDLRRTCAKLCRAAGGGLEQIQLLLAKGAHARPRSPEAITLIPL